MRRSGVERLIVNCGITSFNSQYCKVEIHTPEHQIFKQFDMNVEFNSS